MSAIETLGTTLGTKIDAMGTTLGTKIDTLGTKIDAMGSGLSTKMDAMITSISGASYAGGTASFLSQLLFASQKSRLHSPPILREPALMAAAV